MATICVRENYYSHFMDEETDPWKVCVNFPRLYLVGNRARALMLIYIILCLLPLAMNKQWTFVFEKETHHAKYKCWFA